MSVPDVEFDGRSSVGIIISVKKKLIEKPFPVGTKMVRAVFNNQK